MLGPSGLNNYEGGERKDLDFVKPSDPYAQNERVRASTNPPLLYPPYLASAISAGLEGAVLKTTTGAEGVVGVKSEARIRFISFTRRAATPHF